MENKRPIGVLRVTSIYWSNILSNFSCSACIATITFSKRVASPENVTVEERTAIGGTAGPARRIGHTQDM